MSVTKKFLNSKKVMKRNVLNFFDRFNRSLKSKKFIVLTVVFAAAAIFLFMENDTVEKLGTISSVIIAAIVCNIQLDSYQKGKIDNREAEAFKKGKFITANLIRYYGGGQQDLHMDYTGDRWKEVRTFDGRRYTLEWRLNYTVHSNSCTFLMAIGHFKDSEKMELTEKFEYLEFYLNDGINSLLAGKYIYIDGNPPIRERIFTGIDNFSNEEWSAMMELLSGILPEYFPK